MNNMEPIELEVNGVAVTAHPGQTIYEVVTGQGLDSIPALCYEPGMQPYASCFVCVVEVAGRAGLVPSCSTVVTAGMKVQTHSARVIASRKAALELLMSNHYADCLAPCVLGCPAHVDVQGYIALAARGEYAAAADLIRQANPLPAVCGRVCVRKCEAVCRRKLLDDAVAINDLKRFITDSPQAYDSWPECAPASGKKVAIIGAGPAGLTAAYFLGLQGHACTILEMMPEPGGMLRYGIPSYRLPREVITQEVDYICSRSHSTLVCNRKLGRDFSLGELRSQYDAVFLSMGAMGSNAMGVAGEENTPGVLGGLNFLIEMAQSPQPMNGTVVVVGGGNTAMDAARTAKRMGADKVVVVYRRTRAEMPADPIEIEAMHHEGIDLVELAAPQELVLDETGKLKAIKCIRMRLGEPDASGRRRPVPVEGSEFLQNCDYCISAIGQSPVLDGIDPGSDDMPAVSKWNTLVASGMDYATRIPGIFAGGDVVTGPSVAIDCIAAGRRAARSIHAFLTDANDKADMRDEMVQTVINPHTAPHCECATPVIMRKDLLAEVSASDLGRQYKLVRQSMPELAVNQRVDNFEEVALGFTWNEANAEWSRCLACGCMKAGNCRLREYCSEYDVDLTAMKGKVRKYRPDERHPYIVIDNNKCILCTKCIRSCEQVLGESALSLAYRGFSAMLLPAMGKALAETACVSCGNCEAVCPTGALTVKLPFAGRAVTAARSQLTTCGFCSLGCPIEVHQTDTGHHWITPPGSSSYLCRFGRFGAEEFAALDRITQPLAREHGQLAPLDYETASAALAAKLHEAVERFSAESVAVFVSPEATCEQMYLAQRIAREGLGTNNIASLSDLLVQPDTASLEPVFGFDAGTSSREALEHADLIVLNNCDLKNDQLILAMKVIKAIKRGAKVIAAAGVHGDLIELATINLEPLRGSTTLLWRGVAKAILSLGCDPALLSRLAGGAEYAAALLATEMDQVLEQSGIESDQLQSCASMLAAAEHVVFIHTPDRPADRSPGDLLQLANLMAMLHVMGRKADLLLPRAAANATGLNICGVSPDYLPGRLSTPDVLRAVTPDRSVLLHRLQHGMIKAALVIGEDPLRHPQAQQYLPHLEYLAVTAMSMNETALAADIVLPDTHYLEEPGSRVNFEGIVHEFSPVLASPAGRQGWEVLAGLALALGVADVPDTITGLHQQLAHAVSDHRNSYTPHYWNTGELRQWEGPRAFSQVDRRAVPQAAGSYITWIQQHKHSTGNIRAQHPR